MAKNDTTLLTDISSQLRKLNQTSVRDKLQEREANERQEAMMLGVGVGAADSGTGDAFVDATEDFRRRFTASTAGAIRDMKLMPSEVEAKEELKDDWFEKIAKESTLTNNILGWQGTWPLWKMLSTNLEIIISLMRGTPLADEEKRREGFAPGMHPNSMKNRIQKGWNADESELDTPEEKKKKTWVQKLLGYPKTMAAWVVASVGTALYDVIKGYETGGVTGAVAAFFGGTGEGGLASGIKGAFKGVGIGIATGFMVGGPIGALVGGILGGVTFGITGALGKDKLEKWLNESKKRFSDGWEEAKTNVSIAWNAVSDAIYHKDADGNAVMFGSLLKWDPDDEDGKLEGSWLKVADYIKKAPGMFAAWLEEKVRGLFPKEFADAIFGEQRTAAQEKILATHNRNYLRMEEEAFAGSLWKTMVENQLAEKGDEHIGIGSTVLGAHIAELIASGNIDAKGDKLDDKITNDVGVIESLLDSARETYLSLEAWRKRDRTEGLVDGRGLHQKGPLIVVDDKSDKSTTTTIINTSTYIDTATSEILGSGNNSQVYQSESGNIYSWQP